MSRQSTITVPVRSLRWFSAGIALALVLSVVVIGVRATAAPGVDEATFVPIVPCRVFDTRPEPDSVGGRATPLGADQPYTLQITGTNGDCSIPADATGVSMNLTALNATQPSFMQVYPADASRPERRSSLNYLPGQAPTPNKVDVKLSATGAVSVYNLNGSVDALGDIVGYYTNSGIQDLVADLASKANAADVATGLATKANAADVAAGLATKADAAAVYSKPEADARSVDHGEIVLSHSTSNLFFRFEPTSVVPYVAGNQVSGDGSIVFALTGPRSMDGVEYGLKSVEYCLFAVTGGAGVSLAEVYGMADFDPLGEDLVARSSAGCYALNVAASGYPGYDLHLVLGGGGNVRIGGVTSTWAPAGSL